MTDSVVGVYADPWKQESGNRLARRWFRAQRFQANPRTEKYMQASFARRWPHGRFVIAAQQTLPAEVRRATTVVKLYPDAIGRRLAWLDRAVSRQASSEATIIVLNGRGRSYLWSAAVRRRLAVRRLLESAMLMECAAVAVLFLATPFLLLWDTVRGRR
jgi:hypothetical protein